MRAALGVQFAFRGVTVVCHAGGAVCVASEETKRHRAQLRAAGGTWRAVNAAHGKTLGWDFASKSAALAALEALPLGH